MSLKSLNYKVESEEIKVGEKYYWGQLSDDEEIQEDGTVAVYNEDGEQEIVAFKIIEVNEEDSYDTLVVVTDIY